MTPKTKRSSLKAAIASEAILGEVRQGVEHAFEVLSNHTAHTEGYVAIALKLIDQYGCDEDRERLSTLIQTKQNPRKP